MIQTKHWNKEDVLDQENLLILLKKKIKQEEKVLEDLISIGNK